MPFNRSMKLACKILPMNIVSKTFSLETRHISSYQSHIIILLLEDGNKTTNIVQYKKRIRDLNSQFDIIQSISLVNSFLNSRKVVG